MSSTWPFRPAADPVDNASMTVVATIRPCATQPRGTSCLPGDHVLTPPTLPITSAVVAVLRAHVFWNTLVGSGAGGESINDNIFMFVSVSCTEYWGIHVSKYHRQNCWCRTCTA